MIWDKEAFLPAHKDMFSLSKVWYVQTAFASLFLKRPKCREFAPMLQVHLIGRAPVFMLRKE
jgi:hypothetical protein